jgi:hypothetical protein
MSEMDIRLRGLICERSFCKSFQGFCLRIGNYLFDIWKLG